MYYDINKNLLQITYPVWLNADILPGPVKATTTPVDPVKFLTLGAKHPRTVLSIGWTTRYGGNITEGEYSRDQIGTMLRMINEYHINQTVTFPVSQLCYPACYIFLDVEVVQRAFSGPLSY